MLFRSRPAALGIAEDALEFALSAAADTHPNEYMGVMRGTPAVDLGVDEDGDIVTDVVFAPGTTSSPVQATLRSDLVPNDSHNVGTIHSHPNGVIRPSNQDVQTFGKGQAHVIVGAPYGPGDWAAYDRQGEPRDFEVYDVDLPDPEEFFDFSQADIDAELEGR